ncbi:MAG: response regulator [Pseudomonadota bacterium]|nr:response regulator [Pseudomonadota bacterium]
MQADDKVNILLVDDQQAKLLSHEAILAEMGETLLKATSAKQAFEVLLKNEVALILIDVCMPDLDGFELAAMIRDHPRFQTTAIIFVSAVMMGKPDQLRGYQLGGVDYVPVPVVPELLRAKVKVFVELYRKTRQLERFNTVLEQRVAERTVELKRFNEELEKRIEDRTREREIAIAQLFEAQKMDAIGRLTGGVAHDFNNLLMAVLGSLTLLDKKMLPADVANRRLLQNAIQGAQRGAALTQRLLAFSRRQELRPESVDCVALLTGMEDLLRRAIGHGIQLSLKFLDDLPPILVDSNQLELAVLNVSINARDAMPDGGRLTITASPVTKTAADAEPPLPPGEYLCISMVDTGIGMDQSTLAKATEPFFTTKGPGKGTGLGLSMVHGLAAQLGGYLRITSELHRGTTVDLWLPAAKTVAVNAPCVEAGSGVLQTPASRVLLVDDDPLVLTGAAALIEDLGHTAIEAHSGTDALAKLATGMHVDLVITDHSMPGMTGFQLIEAIKERYPGLPVILATGYAELPQDPARLGVLKLSKPFSQDDLAGAIHTALSGRYGEEGVGPTVIPDGRVESAARRA